MLKNPWWQELRRIEVVQPFYSFGCRVPFAAPLAKAKMLLSLADIRQTRSGTSTMQALEAVSVYTQWMDQPVVLQVSSAGLHVSLQGIVVAETDSTIRLRVENNLEIDIYKQMILAVEEESWVDIIT